MDSVRPDVRVCFVGDSFVAGVGDEEHLGWAGRLAAHSHAAGAPLTAYNLGIRRDTSADVLGRWQNECTPRLPAGCRAGVVVSLGVNDTMIEGGRLRVDAAASPRNLAALLHRAGVADWPVLVAGPPAVEDEHHNDRLAALDAELARVCALNGTPFVSVLGALRGDRIWRRQVRAGDGAHPGADGYRVLADLIRPAWQSWLTYLVRFEELH